MTIGEPLDGMPENPYFRRAEFECKCGCGGNTVDFRLLEVLTMLRAAYSSPITITSGYRCAEHNKAVGGSPKSQHLVGKAADIVVTAVAPKEVYDLLDEVMQGWGGVGLYDGFVHLDVRCKPARWGNSLA